MKLFVLSLFIAIATLSSVSGQNSDDSNLGPEQICRCYQPTRPPPSCDPKPKDFKVDISFIADEAATLFINGKKVGSTSQFDELKSVTYDGPCADFVFKVETTSGGTGVSVLATIDGKKYGTSVDDETYRVSGVTPIFGITKFKPGNKAFKKGFNNFGSWKPLVIVNNLLSANEIPNFKSATTKGAFPVGPDSGTVRPGTYGIKLSIPFCE